MTATNSNLTPREKELLSYCTHGTLSRKQIANLLGVSENTIKSHLYRIYRKLGVNNLEDAVSVASHNNDLRGIKDGKPTHPELYQLLKKGPMSLTTLSERFDRSGATILGWIKDMEDAGYAIEREEAQIAISKVPKPGMQLLKPQLADWRECKRIKWGVFADLHAGSTCAQPTALNAYIRTAVDEGVENFFVPGDISAGMFGYRGQEYDLIPTCRPGLRQENHLVVQNQAWLVDTYLPKIPKVTYYILGGNHDWWHVKHAGLDALRIVADERDDIVYLGYDVADVPLTNKITARLTHPSGGVPYALSYRAQKHIEQVAFQQLKAMVEEEMPPTIRFVFLGHLHIEVKFTSGSITASQVGCFEGQTNYLKSKGLFPVIGGQIWHVDLSPNGEIRRVGYEFLSYPEIEDDWKNWPVPSDQNVLSEPDEMPEVIFKLVDEDVS